MIEEKTIWMKAAFDKRNKDPIKDYGVHGVDIYFTYKLGDNAVRLTIFSNWYILGSVSSYHNPGPDDAGCSFHSKSNDIDGTDCDIFGKCVGDTYFITPFDWYDILTRKGSDGIFDELAKLHNEIFIKDTS